MFHPFFINRQIICLFNKRRNVQGWCDSPLTELGIIQAGLLQSILKLTI